MEDVKIKGAVVNGFIRFIKKKWGLQGQSEAMNYAQISEPPADAEWFSMVRAYMLVEWVAKTHGENYVEDMGREMPKEIGGELRFVFASLIGFDRLLKRLQKEIPSMMFKGAVVELRKNDKKDVILTLKNVKFSDISCVFWKGALMGMMEHTHTRGTVEQITAPDQLACAYHISW